MRILLVYDHVNVGGSQTHGLSLATALMRAGHAVAVASRGGRTAAEFERAGARHLSWPAPRWGDAAGLLRGLLAAGRFLRGWQPDVVHAHAVLPGVLFAMAARRRPGGRIPVIFTPHRSWHSLYHFPGSRPFSGLLYRVLKWAADDVIAVSNGLYRELIQHGIPGARCHLIPNGVDPGMLDAVPGGAQRLVGTIGRLVPQKGIHVFIDAAWRVAREAPDVDFLIVGDGPLRKACLRRIAARGLRDRIRLAGEQSNVSSYLKRMSVFVSTSRWEGMPYALLEALAAQRPVVATRVPGSSELIIDGVHGVLVPPDDPGAMGAAILELLNDPDRAQALGRAGRQLIESHYSQQAMAEQIMALYTRAIAERSGGPDDHASPP